MAVICGAESQRRICLLFADSLILFLVLVFIIFSVFKGCVFGIAFFVFFFLLYYFWLFLSLFLFFFPSVSLGSLFFCFVGILLFSVFCYGMCSFSFFLF